MAHERRIFLNEDLSEGATVQIPPEDVHHLRKVLRFEIGDEIVVVATNSKKEFVGKLSSWDPGLLSIKGQLNKNRIASQVIGVCPALCKGSTNDLIVEKATELGVERILFWSAERSIIKFKSDKEREERRSRYQKIAEEASKQAARNTIPSVEILPGLKALLGSIESEGIYWGSLAPEANTLNTLVPFKSPTYIVIGPEGDFCPEEEKLLFASNSMPFTLGTNRLKVETAVLASIAALNEISRGKAE